MAEPEIISPALGALLDIMTSAAVPEMRSIEAARAVIEYEAPAEVFELTYQFLMGIACDAGKSVELKLEALKLIRKVEAKRVMPGHARAVDVQDADRVAVRIANAQMRLTLIARGMWPAGKGWYRGVPDDKPGSSELARRLQAARHSTTGR